jgi:hypothetical protein
VLLVVSTLWMKKSKPFLNVDDMGEVGMLRVVRDLVEEMKSRMGMR